MSEIESIEAQISTVDLGQSSHQLGTSFVGGLVHIFCQGVSGNDLYHVTFNPFTEKTVNKLRVHDIKLNGGVSTTVRGDGIITSVFTGGADNRIQMVHYHQNGTYSPVISAPADWTSAYDVHVAWRGESLVFTWRKDANNIQIGIYDYLYETWNMLDMGALANDCQGALGPATISMNQDISDELLGVLMLCWESSSDKGVSSTIYNESDKSNSPKQIIPDTITLAGLSLIRGKSEHEVILGFSSLFTAGKLHANFICLNTYTQTADYKSGKWMPRNTPIEGAKSELGPRLLSIGNKLYGFYVELLSSNIKYFTKPL